MRSNLEKVFENEAELDAMEDRSGAIPPVYDYTNGGGIVEGALGVAPYIKTN